MNKNSAYCNQKNDNSIPLQNDQGQYKVSQKENPMQELPEIIIDTEKQRYPYSIVWTSLPIISCCCPCIGHTGIGNSDGIIYDFAGSQYIGEDDLAFGKPYKYVPLDLEKLDISTYDKNIYKANQNYLQQNHNLITNNCHSHVANALNLMEYDGKKNWTMVGVCCLATFKSRYVNMKSCIQVYYQFLIFMFIVAGIVLLVHYA